MYELILIMSLFPAQPEALTQQIQPCVWPNTCVQETVAAAQQIQPCVWPNTCRQASEEPITTCDYPNKCS